jgi:hypothetical protein
MKKENFTSLGICFSCGLAKQKGKDVIAWDTRARTDKAFMLYKAGYIHKIVCTGGICAKEQKIPLANLMQDYLLKLGVPKQDILIEDQSLDTTENVKFSFLLLKKKNFFKNLKNTETLRLVMISEPHHLQRIEITSLAYLKKHKVHNLVPVLLETVQYHLSEKTMHEEEAMLHHTILDPLGRGEIFEKIRDQRRQQ